MTTPDASRRSDRAQQAILTAARDLVADVGYARLTVEAIAARAGVGKQTIYRWWPGKAAVVFDAILAEGSGSDGSVALPDTGDLRADLRQVLRTTVAGLVDPTNDRLQRAVVAEIQTDPVVADQLVQRLLRPQLEATAARIRAAADAGEIDPAADPGLATELLFGPVFHRWLLRTAPLDESYADDLVDLVLAGLRTR